MFAIILESTLKYKEKNWKFPNSTTEIIISLYASSLVYDTSSNKFFCSLF